MRLFVSKWSVIVLSATLVGCVTTSGIVVPSTNYYDKKVVDLKLEVFRVPTENRPTVIVLHGSGGVEMHHRDWAKMINSWGYNAVLFDSFMPRGIRDVNARPFDIPFLQRALDAEAVAKWVTAEPWSNKNICALGFSHGGVTVLGINMDGYVNREIGGAHSFKCGVNYYGLPMFDMFFSKATMPIQIHVGSNDGMNDINRNRDFAKKFAADTELFIYPNAEHGFDRVATNIRVKGVAGVASGGSYVIKGDPIAREQSIERVKVFFDRHLN
jgi:dienelactone hydrolase